MVVQFLYFHFVYFFRSFVSARFITNTNKIAHSLARSLACSHLFNGAAFRTQTLTCWLFPMFIIYIYMFNVHIFSSIMILLGIARKVGKRMMEQTAHDSEQGNE